ncbi:Asp-tRNA(Asn)/Glu-tRNA(Gln) amidotransferase subunit GatA [Roseburia hominis]|uniref:Asp-tRNA(Asn)/Glu-tRNA(Gln) amidotransferase subunit GatA n=1 Tax=Roseburia hominis TaxID=301301 RepID=UPI0026F32D12|nr:Asp-tRNA(Asn)/Glu-tRNA(Gln) amidotransferase subunit GatA [Roseburia hominis]MCI7523076.1 Asp-tRNA(Asn)/Glu-tRNA(Gln) amidotransferase subunit GatA [Roseburia hominis]
MSLMSLTAVELGRKIKEKEVTVEEAVTAALDAIEKREAQVHSFVTVDREGALKRAKEVQAKIDAGELTGPLAGVPVAIKDNMCTKGLLTTCSSKILYNFVPTYTAEAVLNLEKAGAVILGKTNMDEFAMGSTTETSAYGVTKNPWNTGHVPGGSSGGSCAAVAAEECSYALGSDTGGSIRQPSSFCGVTGIKPTYGTVSRYGLIAYGSSLDQIGPIAKDVTDCATILEAIASHDVKDSTSVQREDYDFTAALVDDVRGMKIGIPRDYFGDGLDPEVKAAVLGAAKKLEEKGAVVEEFDLSLVEYAIPAYYVIACAEASSNLARFDGVKYGYRTEQYDGLHNMYKKTRSEGFGAEAKRRIMLGSFVLSSGYYDAYYLKALRTKALIKQAFDKAFEKYDVILGPAAPTTAPKLGESLSDPLKMYLGDIYTISVNLAGLPGITLPCGTDQSGLPIGLQLIGDCFAEKKIIRAAYTYEQTRSYEHSPLAR